MRLKKINALLVMMSVFLSSSLFSSSKALNDYISQFNTEVTQNAPLTFTGAFETGQPQIKEISLYYSWKQPMQMDLARQKFVEFVSQFLEGLNQNMRLRGQLDPFPFPEKGLDLIIFFRNDRGKYASAPNIGQISLNKGQVTYYEYKGDDFVPVYQESFFDAKKKIFH